ncbi:hypothetical protein PS645_01059 [Pseudomonas fluorescens]|uniref:Uncharacterized protein n=1 Tax=Pseudomonas fluorescens TaxID=294 RepID=A0A5E6QLH2_PSEFL|nr:hypothetical protein PS645_01059 [Pseudomonas fluorescens]
MAALAQKLLFAFPLGTESLRVTVEIQSTTDDPAALGRCRVAAECNVEAETVEQLWTQFALFRVHGADQYELRRMAMGNAVTLDDVGATGSDVEQQIDEVIRQQIDFIDIEHAAVGLGQNTGGKLRAAFAEGCVEVKGADQPLFGRAEGQGDKLAAGEQVGEASGQG